MISAYKPTSEFFTGERCYIIEIHNRSDDEDCSIARVRVTPGVTTQLHALRGTVERYVILEGEGRVEIGGEPATLVRPLDVVYIPKGASQRITSTADDDLIFLAICIPRFRRENYIDRESTSSEKPNFKGS